MQTGADGQLVDQRNAEHEKETQSHGRAELRFHDEDVPEGH